MSDAINPDHYKRLPSEAIEIIEAAIDKAPSNQDAYLHGQVLKYILRCWNKNGIEDLKKAKWYLDRLVDSLDEYEQQKAADLQSLKDHPFGKPKWKPKIGDWVKIKKPKSVDDFLSTWMPGMDKYDEQIVKVEEFDGKSIVHDEWCFMFGWLEPAEAPKQPAKPILNSDKIPEGYRKLNDSSNEPRQIGDLRWSVAEKRYVEISVDEIGYANRDNWAACRKVEPAIKQSLKTEPPDGWRFLEVGEVIRKGDQGLEKGLLYAIEPMKIGMTLQSHWMPTIRRNRFEVGEKVVWVSNNVVYKVIRILSMGYQLESEFCAEVILHGKDLAPYIEEAT